MPQIELKLVRACWVNEEAKALLPEGPQAPAEITYEAVDTAAE